MLDTFYFSELLFLLINVLCLHSTWVDQCSCLGHCTWRFIWFVWGFSSHSRVFWLIWRRHHFRWRATNVDLYSALMTIEQWGFLMRHIYWDTGHPVYWSSRKTGDTYTCCRAFRSVTTCFKELGLSRLDALKMYEHEFWDFVQQTVNNNLTLDHFQI